MADTQGCSPRRSLAVISRAVAALTNTALLASAIAVRAVGDNARPPAGHHRKTWVSSERFRLAAPRLRVRPPARARPGGALPPGADESPPPGPRQDDTGAAMATSRSSARDVVLLLGDVIRKTAGATPQRRAPPTA